MVWRHARCIAYLWPFFSIREKSLAYCALARFPSQVIPRLRLVVFVLPRGQQSLRERVYGRFGGRIVVIDMAQHQNLEGGVMRLLHQALFPGEVLQDRVIQDIPPLKEAGRCAEHWDQKAEDVNEDGVLGRRALDMLVV